MWKSGISSCQPTHYQKKVAPLNPHTLYPWFTEKYAKFGKSNISWIISTTISCLLKSIAIFSICIYTFLGLILHLPYCEYRFEVKIGLTGSFSCFRLKIIYLALPLHLTFATDSWNHGKKHRTHFANTLQIYIVFIHLTHIWAFIHDTDHGWFSQK